MLIRLSGLFAVIVLAAPVRAQQPALPPSSSTALTRPDPNSESQIGRKQLANYLDAIAASQTAARREAVDRIHTREQAEARQREVRAKILSLLGPLPEKTTLNAVTISTFQASGFRMEKILFFSQPNFPVTAILYLPDKPGGKLPAIVMSPGHYPSGKASDFAIASVLARNGFVVLSYDLIGLGERLQYPDPAHAGQSLASRATGEHGEAGLQPTLIGDAVALYFLWDGIRAVDYLLTRYEVDPDRIGAFGCSGGGTVTALLGALDTRIKAIASACYITSFDTLLPAIGPQDAEQSIPNFIASGLDFPDWIELAAPRPYAVISTTLDMFPFAGARTTVTEARRFYSLFDSASAGTPTGQPEPGIPTGPTPNPDTSNSIPPSAAFQWITGIGRHGNLRPLESQIVGFFLSHLAHSTAPPSIPLTPAGANPSALPPTFPKDIFQVTPTGQVGTSYPNAETVHTLNLKRYAALQSVKPLTSTELQQAVREATHANIIPGSTHPRADGGPVVTSARGYGQFHLEFEDGTNVKVDIAVPLLRSPSRRPATLLLTDSFEDRNRSNVGDKAARDRMNNAGTVYLAVIPRPSPTGTEESKSPILGSFYLTGLRAELVGKTLLGLRVDDVIRAVDYLANRNDVDPDDITAVATGHLGLVLLHAAVLDPRLKHITIDHTLESYKSLLEAPMPLNAPEDILPGVLRRYDIPDLVRELGPRLTFNNPLPGTADLSAYANVSP